VIKELIAIAKNKVFTRLCIFIIVK